MNHFKRVSNRVSWYELRRLQSSSSVSEPKSQNQIPARIKRSSTDILSAIEATVPKTPRLPCAYQMDPYLVPIKKADYRFHLLAYESGKNAAHWVHDKHRELFPKHLSEPEVEAFKPLDLYTDKSQVSEEVLVDLTSRQKVSDAIHVYELLEGKVSNNAKQMLLELLCFSGGNEISSSYDWAERWFSVEKVHSQGWLTSKHRTELYDFLIEQDARTAAAAYNAMICGLVKFSRVTEAWALYEQCKKNNVPINITTYNRVLSMLYEPTFKSDQGRLNSLYDILVSINKDRLTPNLRTMNIALRVVTMNESYRTDDIVLSLISEFKRIGVECSLATYFYLIMAVNIADRDYSSYFEKIIMKVPVESHKIKDPNDSRFFYHGMYIAQTIRNKWAGERIHKIFLTGDNSKMFPNRSMVESYYSWYLLLLLKTSEVEAFFKSYEYHVPILTNMTKRVYESIIDHLLDQDPTVVVKYVSKLWADMECLAYYDVRLKLKAVQLMKVDFLPADSPLKTDFAEAAWSCWMHVQTECLEVRDPVNIRSSDTALLAIILLRAGYVKHAEVILAAMVKNIHLFIPTTFRPMIDELFELCLSEKSIAGALSILEYSIKSGYQYIPKTAKELKDLELTDTEKDELTNLTGIK